LGGEPANDAKVKKQISNTESKDTLKIILSIVAWYTKKRREKSLSIYLLLV